MIINKAIIIIYNASLRTLATRNSLNTNTILESTFFFTGFLKKNQRWLNIKIKMIWPCTDRRIFLQFILKNYVLFTQKVTPTLFLSFFFFFPKILLYPLSFALLTFERLLAKSYKNTDLKIAAQLLTASGNSFNGT